MYVTCDCDTNNDVLESSAWRNSHPKLQEICSIYTVEYLRHRFIVPEIRSNILRVYPWDIHRNILNINISSRVLEALRGGRLSNDTNCFLSQKRSSQKSEVLLKSLLLTCLTAELLAELLSRVI